MDAETRKRCLEPFFTTKGERGTGLGLAMVYGTMQRHSGDIEIDSEPGRGTTMRLLFLLPQQVVKGRDSVPGMRQVILPRRILVIDDDPGLRRSLFDTLHDEGHHVTLASSGAEGIEAFRAAQSNGEPFEVVITDLGMPNMDGRAVAHAIKHLSPETKVMLLTGWGKHMKEQGDIPAHVDCVLAKPPKLHELREALAAAS
jgi:CheY-like chemotaxis protein